MTDVQTREARGTDNRARVMALKGEGKTPKEIMEITGLKKPTVYAYLRPAQAPKAKAKTATKAAAQPASGSGGGINVTPTKGGRFLVEVPADKLSKVAAALA